MFLLLIFHLNRRRSREKLLRILHQIETKIRFSKPMQAVTKPNAAVFDVDNLTENGHLDEKKEKRKEKEAPQYLGLIHQNWGHFYALRKHNIHFNRLKILNY